MNLNLNPKIFVLQGDFSFDALFGNLVNELLPSFQEEEADSADGHGNVTGNDTLPNGHKRAPSDAIKFTQGLAAPLFPEVDALSSLFKDSCRELIDLRKQASVCALLAAHIKFLLYFFADFSVVLVLSFRLMTDSSISRKSFLSKILNTARHLLRLVTFGPFQEMY